MFYRRQIKQLEKFHMCALRSILRIYWQDRITNLEVLEHANSTSTKAMLLKAQLHWVGHVIRMVSNHIPRHLLYDKLTTDKINQCRPRMRFKDNITEHLRWCNIYHKELESNQRLIIMANHDLKGFCLL